MANGGYPPKAPTDPYVRLQQCCALVSFLYSGNLFILYTTLISSLLISTLLTIDLIISRWPCKTKVSIFVDIPSAKCSNLVTTNSISLVGVWIVKKGLRYTRYKIFRPLYNMNYYFLYIFGHHWYEMIPSFQRNRFLLHILSLSLLFFQDCFPTKWMLLKN